MRDIPKGLLAGLVATIVLSLLRVSKAMTGLPAATRTSKNARGDDGFGPMPIIGWTVHFAVGNVIYGVAVAALESKLPGLFGMNMDIMASVMTTIVHLFFGAVLG